MSAHRQPGQRLVGVVAEWLVLCVMGLCCLVIAVAGWLIRISQAGNNSKIGLRSCPQLRPNACGSAQWLLSWLVMYRQTADTIDQW